VKEAVELFSKSNVKWALEDLEREAPEVIMEVENH